MKKTTWNTYFTTGYCHDVAQDQRSAGGVHHHQIRRTKNGWQHRTEQSNGRHRAFGPVSAVAGAAAFETARSQYRKSTPVASEYEGSIRLSPKDVKKIKRALKQSLQQAESANAAASGAHAEALKKALKLITSKEAVMCPGGDS